MRKINFNCSVCGHNKLEEILTGVTQSTLVTNIDEEGAVDYGDCSFDGGDEVSFQCARCGDVIMGHNVKISDGEDLLEWLKENEMIEMEESV